MHIRQTSSDSLAQAPSLALTSGARRFGAAVQPQVVQQAGNETARSRLKLDPGGGETLPYGMMS